MMSVKLFKAICFYGAGGLGFGSVGMFFLVRDLVVVLIVGSHPPIWPVFIVWLFSAAIVMRWLCRRSEVRLTGDPWRWP
jgi:hypothetical protein